MHLNSYVENNHSVVKNLWASQQPGVSCSSSWRGGRRPGLHNALHSFLLCDPHLPPVSHVGSKKPNQTPVHMEQIHVCSKLQQESSHEPLCWAAITAVLQETEKWESQEWPGVFISSHFTDLWSAAVLYFKALTVSDQCRNIPQCNNTNIVFKCPQSTWKNQQNIFLFTT